MVYHTCRLFRSLGYKSILNLVIPTSCKNGYLQDAFAVGKGNSMQVRRNWKWRRWRCFIRKWQKFRKWVSDSEIEKDPVEKSESSDIDMTPPPQKITKEQGWKWNVTGDRPTKLHFTGNPGIRPAIIRNLPPEPNPLEVFQLIVHNSLWDEIATKTNRFAVQFYDKNPNSPTISQWFPTTSHEIKAYCACHVPRKKPNLQSYWSIRKSLHTPFFRVYHTKKNL